MSQRRLAALLLMLVPALACRARASGGQIEGNWIGSADSKGKFKGAATASWCDSLRVLEVSGVRGDTGLALAVYPESVLTAGGYPARDPMKPDTARPGVSAAARWFTQTAVSAYRSDSGALELELSGGAVFGRFGFRMLAPQGSDTVRLDGRVQGVPVLRNGPGCPARSVSDTGRRD